MSGFHIGKQLHQAYNVIIISQRFDLLLENEVLLFFFATLALLSLYKSKFTVMSQLIRLILVVCQNQRSKMPLILNCYFNCYSTELSWTVTKRYPTDKSNVFVY